MFIRNKKQKLTQNSNQISRNSTFRELAAEKVKSDPDIKMAYKCKPDPL